MGRSFVPLARASVENNEVRVPFDKSEVKDAPRVEDPEGHLSLPPLPATLLSERRAESPCEL